MRQLRAAASFAPPPPVSRPSIPPRHFGEAPCPPAAPPFGSFADCAKSATPASWPAAPPEAAPPIRQLCAAAAQLRAPASAAGPGQPPQLHRPPGQPPRLRVARQRSAPPPPMSGIAPGFRRERPVFIGCGPGRAAPAMENVAAGCALMSADRRSLAAVNGLTRGRLRGRRTDANQQRQTHRSPQHRSAGRQPRPPQFPHHPLFRHTARSFFDNRTSPLPLYPGNRPKSPNPRFTTKSVDSPLYGRFPALALNRRRRRFRAISVQMPRPHRMAMSHIHHQNVSA